MSGPKNTVIVLLALTTLGAGYLAWSQAGEITDLKAALATAGKPQVMTRKRAWAAAPQDMQPGASDRVADPKSGTIPDTAAAVGPAGIRERRHNETAFRELMDNPEYQKLMAVEQKGRLDSRYAALFKKLGLPPDQLEKFKDLLVEKQSTLTDVFAAARAQGLDPRTDPAGYRTLVINAENEIDANIRNAIGDEAFATYQNYNQTQPYRNVVGQLDSRLSYSASPLTDAQSEQLVQIMANANSRPAANGNPVAATPFVNFRGAQNSLNSNAMNQAQGILTPDQYAALRQLQQEQQAQAQLRDLMRQRFQAAAPARSPAASMPVMAAPAVELPH